MRIFGVVQESIVDGPGMRLAVFAQGCMHDCPGCHNPESHAMDGGREESVDRLLALLTKNPMLGGLTLSGGEPFLQAAACAALAKGAKEAGRNVWVYTGYTWAELEQVPQARELFCYTDVLVDGQFELSQRTLELPYRGSANQRLIDVQATLAAGEVRLFSLPDWV